MTIFFLILYNQKTKCCGKIDRLLIINRKRLNSETRF